MMVYVPARNAGDLVSAVSVGLRAPWWLPFNPMLPDIIYLRFPVFYNAFYTACLGGCVLNENARYNQ